MVFSFLRESVRERLKPHVSLLGLKFSVRNGISTSKLHPVGQQDMFAGQTVNLWFESVGGAVMLAAGLGTGYYMLHNRE